MRCPKCGHQRQPYETQVHEGICPACGIAYRKWLERQQDRQEEDTSDEQQYDGEAGLYQRLVSQLTATPERVEPSAFAGRCLLWLGLCLWTVWFAWHGIDWEIIGGSFLHNINLAFHEFGHVFFRPFGYFMTILGGSLFQILLPLAPLFVFVFRQGDNVAGSMMLWWCGQNFVDVAPYIRDAEYRGLPLVGGASEAYHDWGNILTMLNAVDSCYALAKLSFGIGLFIMALALAWGGWLLLQQYHSLEQ